MSRPAVDPEEPGDESMDVDATWWEPDVDALPVGAAFRPGLDPRPRWQHAWAVVKDRWGRPAHGEPAVALRRILTRVPEIGPNEALGYVLYAGLTYNTVFAARGVPISVFDLHDEDAHVAGSGAVMLVAAVGAEVAREGRVKVGELRVLYPGVSELLSPRAGLDPMFADFRIQGYETPDGSFAQFVRCQAPQLLAHSERLTLADSSSFMLDLETVWKALYDVAGVGYDERVFVEGAAGGTGLYAVACAALRGARVTGLVSTEDKGRRVLTRGARAYVNRRLPDVAASFTPVPTDAAGQAAWRTAGQRFVGLVREKNQGAPIDVVVSSVGRDLFPRMVDLLGPGGRLVFFGATSGYTLTFLGKPGAALAGDMYRRARLRPAEGVVVFYGVASGTDDAVGVDAISAAVHAGARVVVVTRTDAQAAHAESLRGVHGVVSVETLARSPAFRWPPTMPDADLDPAGYRDYQDTTLKPFGQAVGRLLATADNPRGYPDLVVERAGQDSLGVSAFLSRPFTGRVVYLESTGGQRLSFYAPNVWMHQKRVLFPTFTILGSHLSNAHQAEEVLRLVDRGALAVHPPGIHAWDELGDANQAIADNRHTGTLTVRVGAMPALDHARTAREVFATWGSRLVSFNTVHVRVDPVRRGHPGAVAVLTIAAPPVNALGRATLEDLERALDVVDGEAAVGAVVITGAGPMFVAGADIRQLRGFAKAEDAAELARRAQQLFRRIGTFRAPVVAAVDGYALGGGNELQMACAYRVAGARAEIGQPEINLHLIPGFGGTQMLPRLLVRHAAATGGQTFGALAAALTVLLDGRRRSARAALALGLVDEVAPADALSRALEVAGRLVLAAERPRGQRSAGLPVWSPLGESRTIAFPNVERDADVQRLLEHHERVPRAVAARAMVDLVRLGLTRGLDEGLAAEAREFGRLVASEDGRAGMDRFLARRSLPLPLRRAVVLDPADPPG